MICSRARKMSSSFWPAQLGIFVAAIVCWLGPDARGENESVKLGTRPSWTGSHVVGSPEPPPPYTVEPVFKHVAWKNPVFAIREPESEWLIVVEWPQQIPEAADANSQSGEKKGPRFKPAQLILFWDNPTIRPALMK